MANLDSCATVAGQRCPHRAVPRIELAPEICETPHSGALRTATPHRWLPICLQATRGVCLRQGGDMDPVIRTNTKARVNLACPECGMSLMKAPQGGFVKYGDTYCCRGCAEGTGCTCYAGTEVRKSFNRPGDIGQRNSENTPGDRNYNAEIN